MGTVIDTELGIPIECDTSGRFSATIGDQFYSDKSLAKVRKAIQAKANTVRVLVNDSYDGLKAIEAATVAPYADRVLATRPTLPGDHQYDHRQYFDPFEYDQDLLDEMKAFGRMIADQRGMLDRQYKEGIAKLKERLVPLTPERFQRLLDEKKGGKG